MSLNSLLSLDEATRHAICGRIEKAREGLGLTQTAAAKVAGIERQQWSRVVKGTSGSKTPTLIRMAKAVGLSLEKLIIEARIEFISQSTDSQSFPLLAYEIVDSLSSTPQIQEHAMASLQAFRLLSFAHRGVDENRPGEMVEADPPPGTDVTATDTPDPWEKKEGNEKGEEGSKISTNGH